MKTLTLKEITEGKTWVGLGIAGNQAGHLGQAGEADDFKDVVSDENAPKGIFPWYMPGSDSFLNVYSLSSTRVSLNDEVKLQPEPEIALIVKFHYASECDSVEDNTSLLDNLSVLGFSAFNDCSRRVVEPKLSMKKNWGVDSKGMANTIIALDDFVSTNGAIEKFRLGCFLVRDGELIQYGKDTAAPEYCYFNQTLVDWMTKQINTQADQGPLEKINQMLSKDKPEYGVIGIGATCYSEFGNSEERFLKADDEVIVVLYDSEKHSSEQIPALIKEQKPIEDDGSFIVLHQIVS